MTTSDGTSNSPHTLAGLHNQSRPYPEAQLFRQATQTPQYTLAGMQNQSRPYPEAQIPGQAVQNPIVYTDQMENNHSLSFSDPLSTSYPTLSSQSGTNTPEIPAPTGSYDFQRQALLTSSMEAQTPMSSRAPFATWNNSSGYQIHSAMGYGSQPEPLRQLNITPGPVIESNFSTFDTIHTPTGFPTYSPMSSNPEFVASRSSSISSPSGFPQHRQGRRASMASLHPRASSSMSNPLQRHHRGASIQKPGRKKTRTPQQVPSSQASSHSSAPLIKWWVEDGELVWLDFDRDGQRISCYARCYHKKMASLVDLDFARDKGFEVHPIPRAKRVEQETPFGKKSPEYYSTMDFMQPVGSVMTLEQLEPQAIKFPDDEPAQMILGKDACVELRLVKISRGKFYKLIIHRFRHAWVCLLIRWEYAEAEKKITDSIRPDPVDDSSSRRYVPSSSA